MKKKLLVFVTMVLSVIVVWYGWDGVNKVIDRKSTIEEMCMDQNEYLQDSLSIKGKERYIEEKIELPEGEFIAIEQDKEGKVKVLMALEDDLKIFLLTNDYTWQEEKTLEHFGLKDMDNMLACGFGEQSVYYLWKNAKDEMYIDNRTFDGKINRLQLTDDKGICKTEGNFYFTLDQTDKGDYIIQSKWIDFIKAFDEKSGKEKMTFGSRASSFKLTEDTIYINGPWKSNPNIYSFDLKTGDLKEVIIYDVTNDMTGINHIAKTKEGIYVFNPNGIQFIGDGMLTWEQLAEPGDFWFCKCAFGVYEAFVLPDNSFLIAGDCIPGKWLYHYYCK